MPLVVRLVGRMSFRVISVKSLDPAKETMKEMRSSFLRTFPAETAESFRKQVESDIRAELEFPPDPETAPPFLHKGCEEGKVACELPRIPPRRR